MSLESRNILEATRRDCALLTDDFSGLPLELLSRLCGACVGRINVQSVDFKKNFLLLLFISDVVAVFRFFSDFSSPAAALDVDPVDLGETGFVGPLKRPVALG